MKYDNILNNFGFEGSRAKVKVTVSIFRKKNCHCSSTFIGKGPQTFSTVVTRIAGDFGLVAHNPLTENGLLFMILSSSAVPVFDLIKTRIIKLFERKHWLRIYRSVIN